MIPKYHSISYVSALSMAGVMFVTLIIASWIYFPRLINQKYDLDKLSEKLTLIKHQPKNDISHVYASTGERIASFYDKFQFYEQLDNIPKDLKNAVIAIEDKNFLNHRGVDPKAVLRASLSQIIPGRMIKQGGSTITQQLVRQFVLSREKSLSRKIREIYLSILLEKQMTKHEILELYLNHMFLGAGCYGVAAASERYFGKKLEHLSLAENALIAGLYQSPNILNPLKNPQKALKRQKLVLKAMLRQKMISKAQFTQASGEKLQFYIEKQRFEQNKAPYFVDYVREQAQKLLGTGVNSRGLRIFTTLDMQLQKNAEKSIDEAKMRLSKIFSTKPNQVAPKDHEIEAALLVNSTHDGSIKAMVGGFDYEKTQFNRATQSIRSPGSAFKTFVYTYALEQGYRWSDVLYVDPVRYDDYTPKNMSHDFLTETTLLRAFYKSLNTPTVDLAEKLGIVNIINFAKKLGINSPIKQEAGTALGSSGLTMTDLARAYSTIANLGTNNELYAIQKIESNDGLVLFQHQVIANPPVVKPETSQLITEGLRSVLDYGTGVRSSDLSHIAVGKTGTSNLSEDNWFCGYSRDLAVMAWVGSEKHLSLSGIASANTVALPIWDRFIRLTDSQSPMEPLLSSESLLKIHVHPEFGYQDENKGIPMYFTPDLVPTKKYSVLKKLKDKDSYRDIFNNH